MASRSAVVRISFRPQRASNGDTTISMIEIVWKQSTFHEVQGLPSTEAQLNLHESCDIQEAEMRLSLILWYNPDVQGTHQQLSYVHGKLQVAHFSSTSKCF